MSLDIKQQYTNNPFLDVLLYNVKQLAYNVILKDESEALANETDESLKASDKLIYSVEGNAGFEYYTFTKKMLISAGCPTNKIDKYLSNHNEIPVAYRDKLVKLAREDVINNYEEKNEYYRKIMGLPKYGDDGIPIKPYLYLIPTDEKISISYLHELGVSGAAMLEKYGVIEAAKQDYPDAEYLDYMSAGISAYKARKANDKQILYLKSCGDTNIDDIFEEKFELARIYTNKCVDTSAMEYNSKHYNAFLCVYILLITIVDTVSELQSHIVKKDILDARCIKYIFDMYGIPYYKQIPLSYQKILCKNVNTLVQYKSSPEEMLNLIMYFKANNIEIFKYLLLKDRKMDSYGEFIFNMRDTVSSIYNTIVDNVSSTVTTATSGYITIPFPFKYYLNKGNKMWIWFDGKKLPSDAYQIFNYNQLKLKAPYNSGTHTLKFDFYYDNTTVDSPINIDKTNSIKLKVQHTHCTTNNHVISLDLPYPNYLKDGNDFIVTIGSTFYDSTSYFVDKTKNTITLLESITIKDRAITFIYAYCDNVTTVYKKRVITSTANGTNKFTIPEPFSGYLLYDNSFFVTKGSTFVESIRYTVDPLERTIKFIDGTTFSAGKSIEFNFLYTKEATFEEVQVNHTSEVITATEDYQFIFQTHPPISNYSDSGYGVYVKLLGWYLDDSLFDFFDNKIQLRDLSISLDPGDKIEIHYYTRTKPNIPTTVEKSYVIASTMWQDMFNITFPFDNYLEKGNALIVASAGNPLTEGVDYTIFKNTIIIHNSDYYVYEGDKLDLEFIYNTVTDNRIVVSEDAMISISNDQRKYYMNFPFFPYLETGHSFLTLNNSTFIHPGRISVANGNELTAEIKNNNPGDIITNLYIYNYAYIARNKGLLKVAETTVDMINKGEDELFKIHAPFDNYFENDWPYFVEDAQTKAVPASSYDLIGSSIAFISDTYRDSALPLTFTFIYKDTEPWVINNQSEDFDNDIDLKFIKVPINSHEMSPYIKNRYGEKQYDAITMADKFWDGPGEYTGGDSLHDYVRSKIKRLTINYARTKYMTVDYLIDLSEMSFQIPFFYNMLWDDVRHENLLNIEIPSIVEYHKFNIANIFCYMTALMYIYKGIDDSIMKTPTQVLHVRGFNFKADLAALEKYILKERRLPEDFDVFGFMNLVRKKPGEDPFDYIDPKNPKYDPSISVFIIPNKQYPNIEAFINTYRNNRAIYKMITNGMANADNYDIYTIWKKLYDSLMVWDFNLNFFKLSNGTVANTFTDFLYEKDNTLYTSIKSIKAISNDDTRQNTIIEIIQDIVYLLEKWIDSKEFVYLLSQFPGVGQEYVLEYLFTIINFFKSYKVILTQITDSFSFDDQSSNYIKPIDVIDMQIHLDKLDYISPRSDRLSRIRLLKNDNIINFVENTLFKYKYT